MRRRHLGVETAGLLSIALLAGCGQEKGGCFPCTSPPESIAGFPRVHREAGTSRVVSELKVGETAYLCAFAATCACSLAYGLEWRSSDSSVASVAASTAPLSVCNGAVEASSTGGAAHMVAELRGLRPGEVQVIATVSGASSGGAAQRVPNVFCTAGVGAGCLNVDLVRVTATE